MHGLINKSIQSFVCLTYGQDRWHAVMRDAELGFTDFEAMLTYEAEQTHQVLDALRRELNRDLGEILEDLGTFLVSNPKMERLRRLLRFAGETYEEFLHSLDDLPDRVRLAIPGLDLPPLELREHATGHFTLTSGSELPGFGSVMMGVLRAMADDYGALVILEHDGHADGSDLFTITLIEKAYAEGRQFTLGAANG